MCLIIKNLCRIITITVLLKLRCTYSIAADIPCLNSHLPQKQCSRTGKMLAEAFLRIKQKMFCYILSPWHIVQFQIIVTLRQFPFHQIDCIDFLKVINIIIISTIHSKSVIYKIRIISFILRFQLISQFPDSCEIFRHIRILFRILIIFLYKCPFVFR